jgi:diguanylate cyclase (GGDEF)-like protein
MLQIALLAWLSGGSSSEYEMLFLLWIASGLGVHPPLRALAFLAVTMVVSAAPLLYDGWSADAAVDVATNVLFWASIGAIMLTLMVTVRAQRVRLRAGELHERELARADALTGLGNRRAFSEALEHELARSDRAHSSVSVVVFDVDGLKAVNDEFGHVEGDRCLVAVGEAIVRSIRAGDRAFRWGGDEFAVLLPDTDYNGAEVAAATVYAEVMRACADARGRPLSVSAGIAEADGPTKFEELVDIADMELMARKREKLALG